MPQGDVKNEFGQKRHMGIPLTALSNPRKGAVVTYSHKKSSRRHYHENKTHSALAERLAAIKGWEYGGEFDPSYRYPVPLYFVPSDTLIASDSAYSLGIKDEQCLFGGVVPFPFVATKTITHPLTEGSTNAPAGWSSEFARQTHDVVLPGFTAFSVNDARRAGRRLLEQGAVRLKKASGIGGLGQSVVRNAAQLEENLQVMDPQELMEEGLVLELNLTDVETYSIGQVKVGDMLATYYGTQDLTVNNQGVEVYGGSRLVIARGDFDALLRLGLPLEMETAASQAGTYHKAAIAAYTGMFASRCNYDVVRGRDEQGKWRTGVLEQSWRIGGASGAEIAALEAFRDDRSLNLVCASTAEVYGEVPSLPADAKIYFQGIDPDVGQLTKYSRLEPYASV